MIMTQIDQMLDIVIKPSMWTYSDITKYKVV